MGLSKQHQWMIGEAIVGTVVGAINPAAGIVLTFGLVGFHLCFDKNQQEVSRCPLEQTLNSEEVSKLYFCNDCPLKKAAIDVEKIAEESE
jgi:phosphopantetheinyl transferase